MDSRYRYYDSDNTQPRLSSEMDNENRTHEPPPKSKAESEDNADDMKKKTFTGLVSRFAGKTSMQGIPYINAARLWYSKAIWALLTAVALGISILHMYYLISLYQQNDTKTQISLNFSALLMPAITICNTNPVRKSEVHGDKPSPEFAEFVSLTKPENLMPPEANNNQQNDKRKRKKRFVSTVDKFNKTGFFKKDAFREQEEIEEDEELGEEEATAALINQFKHLYTDLPRETRLRIGHKMSSMLVSCSFKGRSCTYKKFVRSLSNDYGNCYTIQSSNYKVEKSGPGGGLSMVFFLENHESIDSINHGYGLRVVIHDGNTTAFPMEEGFFVSANTETNIGLRMVNIIRLSEPFGTCVDAGSYETKYGIVYTRQACQSFCVQETIMSKCGCFSEYYDDIVVKMNKTGSLQTYGHCETDKEMKCRYRYEDLYTSGKLTCSCSSPCQEHDYSILITSRYWPVDSYARLLIDGVCENENYTSTACEELKKIKENGRELVQNFIKLNIYFEDLNYQQIEEVQDYEDIQFASDVGGALGLWIGLSMLSVLELGQLLVELAEFGIYKCCGLNCTSSSKKYAPKNSNQKDKHSDTQSSSRNPDDSRHRHPHHYEKDIQLNEGFPRQFQGYGRNDIPRGYLRNY